MQRTQYSTCNIKKTFKRPAFQKFPCWLVDNGCEVEGRRIITKLHDHGNETCPGASRCMPVISRRASCLNMKRSQIRNGTSQIAFDRCDGAFLTCPLQVYVQILVLEYQQYPDEATRNQIERRKSTITFERILNHKR